MKRLLTVFILIVVGNLSAQEFNQVDKAGERHGPWRKYYEGTQQLRYQGSFEHGKEVGEFRFYCGDCGDQPSVIKQFQKNSNTTEVSYFTPNGLLVSTGKMVGKAREGEWLFFHKGTDQVMTREFYTNGKLDGNWETYYPNGQVTEKITYKDGIKEGPNQYFSPEGVLLKDLAYVQDELQGEAIYYNAKGDVVIKGFYKNGKKHGLWTNYADGKLISEERFPKPKKKQ
ncbi:toxin-antitoxin system YwqK family antitoxin [Aureitalea marina]|uniref:Preprotein translocase YidC n=1 Tax=Aureitalea marina TaxID=930804 RepID=A0A2S7KQ95_9FLAO|nr:toxin-antitoxin system YwqK family antitoxin [Aureitalea marina]PQB04758.1 hypothetical protein BST85_07510 [Aureitalea marina]